MNTIVNRDLIPITGDILHPDHSTADWKGICIINQATTKTKEFKAVQGFYWSTLHSEENASKLLTECFLVSDSKHEPWTKPIIANLSLKG